MKKWGMILLVSGLLLFCKRGEGQAIPAYTFTQTAGTYTVISGTTSTVSGDDGIQGGIPIGFTFNFGGTNYTYVAVTTNGHIKLGTSNSVAITAPFGGYDNSAFATSVDRPVIAPLWDDLNLTGGDVQYLTSGVAGSQVFTMQWTNDRWSGSGSSSAPQNTFQIKIFEGTNIIQFIYGTMNGPAAGSSASIGITDATGFISVTPAGAGATYSTITANNSISVVTGLSSGVIYIFSPPGPCTGTPMGGTAAASPTTVACANTSISLSVSGATSGVTGLTYQWQLSPDNSTWTDISGATSTTYTATISANTYFRRATICSASPGYSVSVLVTYTGAAAPTGTGATRCGVGTVNLTATGSGLNWYTVATGGTSIGTGSPFTTPGINSTTTFYVESSTGGNVTVGPTSPTTEGGTIGTQTITWDVNFTTLVSTTIQSVDIFPVASGESGVIKVLTGTGTGGTVLATINYTTTVSGGLTAQTIPINYTISTPGNYSLYTSTLPASGIKRNTSGAAYPYTSAVANITGNGFDNTYFMGMYKWVFGNSCTSGRTAVVATVTPPPTITVSATNNPVCFSNTNTTLNVTSANTNYTYNWVPGGAGTPITVSPVSTTQYVVTATDAGSGCVNKDSITITVSTVTPTAPTITPVSSTLCPNDNPVLLTASGSTQNNTLAFGTQAAQNTASTTSAGYPAPYTVYYGGQRMQMLILASELTAAGYSSGSQFTSLQFPVVSLGANWGVSLTSCISFQVSIGNTALTTLSAFQSGLTQVVSPANFIPVVGYTNTHSFSSAFTWNGTSNIIIETTFSNNITGLTDDLVTQYNSPTSFQSTIVYRADGVTPAVAAAATTINFSYNARPDFKLNGTKSVNTYYWSPVTGLYTNAAATIAYTGTSAATVYASPASTQTYTATASNGCVSTGTNTTITVTTPGNVSGLAASTGGSQVCNISSVTANTTKRFFDGSCNLIAKVQSTGTSPVAGNVNACVKIEATTMFYNSEPYLMRHFDIEPALNASTATARVTLYVLQSEFDDYNPITLFPDLPTGPGDLTGIANLRITQSHGTYSTQPLPGYYSGTSVLINPLDPDILWNATKNWWEISFDVTGFSGFFIHSTITGYPLSTQFISLTGKREGAVNVLKWNVPSEQNIRGYEVERSYDGQNFSSIGFVNSLAPGGNSAAALQYNFTDNNFTGDKQYYRLKQTALDGHIKISPVVLIKSVIPASLTLSGLFPNPAGSFVNVMIESPIHNELTILLSDITGRVLQTKKIIAEKGTTVIPFNTEQLAGGTYLVKVICGNGCENAVMKFVKQ